MKETLTAKEWLDKEDIQVPEIKWGESEIKFYTIENLMEKYANYKTKELKDKIMGFRKNLKQASSQESLEGQEAEYWLEAYNKYFNIKQ